MFEGADDLMQEDRRIGVGGWLLAAAGAASVVAVLIASFATNAHAQAGAGGPIPNVVGSQYLSTPNNVANKQLVPFKVDPDGTLYVKGGVAAGSTTSGQLGSLVSAATVTGTSAYTNGQTNPLTLDSRGNLKVVLGQTSSPGLAPVASGAAAASLVLKNTAGNFYFARAVNVTATAGFCLLINATSAPTTGSAVTPLMFAVLPASGQCEFSQSGMAAATFGTGITLLVSSNASPYTFTSGTITAALYGEVQ